jgi:hypothetical protein
MNKSRLVKLGGPFWQGYISADAKGRRLQDTWVRGIRPEAYELAIRLVGAKRRRVMSPAPRAVRRAGGMVPVRAIHPPG